MKIKVDTGGPYDTDTIYLRLTETDPSHVMLEAVYNYATDLPPEDALFLPGGGLLTITAEGRVALGPNIDPALGFPLDHDGRLMLDEFAEAMTAQRGKLKGKRATLAIDNTRL